MKQICTQLAESRDPAALKSRLSSRLTHERCIVGEEDWSDIQGRNGRSAMYARAHRLTPPNIMTEKGAGGRKGLTLLLKALSWKAWREGTRTVQTYRDTDHGWLVAEKRTKKRKALFTIPRRISAELPSASRLDP